MVREAQLAHRVLKAYKAPRESRGLKVNRVCRESRDLKVQQVQLAQLAQLAHRGLKAKKAPRESRGLKVQQVVAHRVLGALLEQQLLSQLVIRRPGHQELMLLLSMLETPVLPFLTLLYHEE